MQKTIIMPKKNYHVYMSSQYANVSVQGGKKKGGVSTGCVWE